MADEMQSFDHPKLIIYSDDCGFSILGYAQLLIRWNQMLSTGMVAGACQENNTCSILQSSFC